MAPTPRTAWSIRTILYAGLGGLGLLLLAATMHAAAQAGLRLREAQEAIAVVEAAQDAFAALQAARSERGPVQIALSAQAPATEAQLARFAATAAALDPALDRLLLRCAVLACGEQAGGLAAARADVARARQVAGSALRQPLESRPPGLARSWYADATVLVDGLESVLATLSGSMRDGSRVGAVMAGVRDAAYATRDAAGLERTLIAAMMRDGRISPDLRRQMADRRVAAETAWRLTRAAIGAHPVPALAAALAAAQEEYFGRFVALRARIEAALDAGQPAPVSIEEMDRAADGGLRPLMNLAIVPLAVAADSGRADADAATGAVEQAGLMTLLALLCAVAAVMVTRRHVLRPLAAIGEALRRLARHEYGFALPDGVRAAEVAAMAEAVGQCRDGLRDADAHAAAEAAEQQVRLRRAEALAASLARFSTDAAAALATVTEAAAGLDAAAGEMARAAEQTSRGAAGLAGQTRSAAGSSTAAAAGAEQLSVSVTEIGRHVADCSAIVRRAVAAAERTDENLLALHDAAGRIGTVVDLITVIAGHTNLLALNATIEAARAGEAGKGFAVVAAEVKQLAAQTARATGEIGGHVAAVRAAGERAAAAIRDIGSVVTEVDEVAAAIAAAVAQQSEATGEIARNVAAASGAVGTASADAGALQDAASRADAVAGRVRAAADMLADQSADLRRRVESFLHEARAA